MEKAIDFSAAITAALNAGMLEDAEYLIDVETHLMFDEEEEEVIELSMDDIELL